ncbi:ATP-binding protein [Paenibacillus sp.]|uniref:ATP-binding protein n=1 Tax=Paenibacillus sp. TaxID=58172 RepID=UPI002D653A50|nr:ATP-binding protein [Paenibacillus sp.]HZG83332.1 ATP-binding protein [Paenibacillus sp.]
MIRTWGVFVLAGAAVAAADAWISGAMSGALRTVWIAASNVLIFGILGWRIHRLDVGKRSAERGLLRVSREAVALYTLRGACQDMNELMERMLGTTAKDARGAAFADWLPERDRARARAAFAQAAEGQPRHFDSHCLRADGTSVDVEVTYVPVLSSNRIVGVYCIMKDISELKRNRERLQHSEKLAAIGELAAGIAHEIRNPLTTLRGFLQLIHRSGSAKYSDIMLSEVDRIHTIANELLLLGKPQAYSLERKPIASLLEAIATLVNAQAALHNTSIRLEKEPGIDGALVLCEETKIKQVFLNILKNAVESMPEGGIVTIRIGWEGPCVHVRIADQGVGIPEHILPKLGQAFLTTKEAGTGLGLMISYGIIEQHGGRMTIESEEGVGTTVHLRLPIEPDAAAPNT